MGAIRVRSQVRHVFAILIMSMLVFGNGPAAIADASDPGGTFTDDNGSVHEANIEAVAAAGITLGCNPPTNDRFCPGDAVTRGQMAAFVVRAFDFSDGVGDDLFDDDDTSVFEADIDRLARAGVTRGCTETTFCPGAAVTRGQMAAFLVRAKGYTDGADDDLFSDDDGSIFEDDIDKLATAGVTLGCNPPDNTRYCPDVAVTRAEMATFLTRALGLTPIQPAPPDLPPDARPEDVSNPDHVIGDGAPAGCTDQDVIDAVAQGGVIVFDCGPEPVTIEMNATAKLFNDRPDVVIDGGGLVTLDGGGDTRILYMNTCDPAQIWTTPHCTDQDHPRLSVQNITFANGHDDGIELEDGGGAIWSRGGRLKIIASQFHSNTCSSTGPDVGGAVRVFDQYQDQPVYVVDSVFGGSSDQGNVCSNGGALSSIGVSWTIINSRFTYNEAVGYGANPAQPSTPGGGNGGAMAFDGNTIHVAVIDSVITDNHAREGGGGIFFVSNDRSGTLRIEGTTMRRNPSDQFETLPGIFYLGNGEIQIVNSVIE